MANLQLRSPLSPDQCLEMLRANIDPQWKIFGSMPVLGSVRGNNFKGYKRIFYGNSFRTFMYGQVATSDRGSLISLRFGISRITLAFMAFWVSGVLIGGGAVIFKMVQDMQQGIMPVDAWPFLLIPPMMLVFAFGLYKFCRWLGRNEAQFLTDFVKGTLRAS